MFCVDKSTVEEEDQRDVAILNRDGYDVELVTSMPKDLVCPLCKKLIKKPIQTETGSLACKYCYEQRKGDSTICPLDNEALPRKIFEDKFKAMEIQNLRCVCKYRKTGCPWIGTVSYVEAHQQDCEFQPLKCPLCKMQIPEGSIYENHLNTCKPFENSKCFFSNVGCTAKMNNEIEHQRHLKIYVNYHLLLQQKSIEKCATVIDQAVVPMEVEVINQDLKLQEKVQLVESELTKLQENIETVKDSLSQNQDQHQINPFESNLANLSVKLADTELRHQISKHSSYDGKIIWKIDRFAQRLTKAVEGSITAFHSPPCFDGMYGYKFCGRVYLNGDGLGKCSHLSLYFVLMKSPYDDLLDWPFQKGVMFKIYNQEDLKKSIQETFMPDAYSSSFKQPKKNYNVAAGCPMFISKDELLNYGFVKNDSIYLEISLYQKKM